MKAKVFKVSVPAIGTLDANNRPPYFPWIDTGINVDQGRRLTIVATGRTNPFTYGNDSSWSGPEGRNGVYAVQTWMPSTQMKLMGRFGQPSSTYAYDPAVTFEVGEYYDQFVPTGSGGRLFLAINDTNAGQPYWFLDNRGSVNVRIVVDAPPKPNHNCNCPYGHDKKARTANPIELDPDVPNKVLSLTDFSVQTPAGFLSFERHYNQVKRTDLNYQYMGLGWSHNHGLKLKMSGSAPGRTVEVYTPDGGTLKLGETINSYGEFGDFFKAQAGSVATLTKVNTNWVLTVEDKTKIVFESTPDPSIFRIIQRQWPSGEVSAYTYTNGNLTEVGDGYGRKLKFSYLVSGGYDNGMLWRAGDQTSTGLDTGSPTGRYIQFGYTPEKSNGTVVSSPKALLASIRDVRGNTWTYDYFGQQSGQTDANLLNSLTKRLTPVGLSMEEVVYQTGTPFTIQQKRGQVTTNGPFLEENRFIFKPGGKNLVLEERLSGSTSLRKTQHLFANGVYLGPNIDLMQDSATGQENSFAMQAVDGSYRTGAQVDGNNNITRLDWSTNGARLQQVRDALGNSTRFSNELYDRLGISIDAEMRKTMYCYDGDFREPAVTAVADLENLIINGDMEATSGWTALGNPVHGRSSVLSDTGTTSWYVNASTGEGIESNAFDFMPGRLYLITARVYVLSGSGIQMTIPNGPVGSQNNVEYGVWETLQAVCSSNSLNTGLKLQFSAPSSPAEFYVDNVIVCPLHEIDVAYGADWHTFGSAAYQLGSGYPSEDGRVTRDVVSFADNQGIESPGVTLMSGRTYAFTARLKVMTSGVSVNLRLMNGTTLLKNAVSANTAEWQTVRFVFTASGTIPNATLQFLTSGNNGSAAEFILGNYHLLETSVLRRWQEFLYDGKRRVIGERVVDTTTAATQQETMREYGTSGVSSGLLTKSTQVDVLNPVNNTSLENTYDDAGRIVKTKRSSLIGSCQFTYTIYDPAGNVLATVCGPDNVTPPVSVADAIALHTSNPDNKVTTYEYDVLGRRIKTISNDDGNASNINDFGKQNSFIVYDALNRVVRSITNYADQGEPPENWVWDITDQRWEKSNGTPINHGVDKSQNLITITTYNAAGVVKSQVDVLGNFTLFGYDASQQLVRTVQNASNRTYNNDYNGDLSLTSYPAGSNSTPDLDFITTQIYDPAGNLVTAVDAVGNATFMVYDPLNRVTKTIQNAKDTAAFALQPGQFDTDPRSSTYALSSSLDRDFVSLTEYDAMGRVSISTSTAGDSVAQTQRVIYDELGRVSKTIQNYQGTTNPAAWLWSVTNNRWEDGSGNAIDHGTGNDQNIVAATYYDTQGRTQYTRDMLGRVTRFVYDGSGRQVKTIRNYVAQGTTDPANWTWSIANSRWEDGTGMPIALGAGFDQNLLSETEYDPDGRAKKMRDAQGRRTWYTYDTRGRVKKTLINCTYISGLPDPDNDSYVGSTNSDQDVITRTFYDAQERVDYTEDALGRKSKSVYDRLGRRIKQISNYVVQGATNPVNWLWSAANKRWEDGAGNAISSGASSDQNIISDMLYDVAGRLISTRDARGTQTLFTYDTAGRQVKTTVAAGSAIESSTYTSYDRGGRVLRRIANYRPQPNDPLPDARDGSGNYLFRPSHNGPDNDQNIITAFGIDKAGRQVSGADALGNTVGTIYDRDGQATSTTDVLGYVTKYGYDKLRRRIVTVAGYNHWADPAGWYWDDAVGQKKWKYADGQPVQFQSANDRNVIARVSLDRVGRVQSIRDARGNLITYAYDLLDRRTTLTNALSQSWTTAYENLSDGRMRQTQTNPLSQQTQQAMDRLGRLQTLQYLGETAPKPTPDVTFTYNKVGNRLKMSESNGLSTLREMTYGYDSASRLNAVGFDDNGDGTVDRTVSYEYDAGSLRTKLTLPGNLVVTYQYNSRGQLTQLTDWSSAATRYAYDSIGRLASAEQANGLRRQHRYDAAGRLTRLRHSAGNRTLGDFAYTLDARGNRIQAVETTPKVGTGAVTYAYNDATIIYDGVSWTDANPFKSSARHNASLQLVFTSAGDATLRMGTGPDHSTYDLYVNGDLWRSVDGYAATASEVALTLTLRGEGPHRLEVRNRPEKHPLSTGYTVRFKSLVTAATAQSFDLNTLVYTYDALSRLRIADRYPAVNTGATTLRRETYAYDVAGNRTQQAVSINGGAAATTNYTYDAANRMATAGAANLTYDTAGRMTSDGTNTYTWDRADRMLSMGASSYLYNGMGQRISQTVSAQVTQYLLDVQPGLYQVLAATTGANTTRYVHGPLGIQNQQNPAGAWVTPLQDGLGSVRGIVNNTLALQESRLYTSYGEPFGTTGTNQTAFGYTGEPMDGNGLVHLRARYYNPVLGVFPSLDPLEGDMGNPLSLDQYVYVQGNPVNWVDSSGLRFNCANEGSLGSACEDLNTALDRAEQAGLALTAIVGMPAGRDSSQKLSYSSLKQNAQNLFGVAFSLYIGKDKEPNSNCDDILQNSSAKYSLTQSVAAMIHVISRFKEVGFSDPTNLFRTSLGVRYQFNDARQPDGAGFTPEASPNQLFLGYNNSRVPAKGDKQAYNTGFYVATSTIVHELGHAFDRAFSYRPSVPLRGLFIRDVGSPTYKSTDTGNPQATQGGDNGSRGMSGRAATSNKGDQKETWADMFMTWVFSDYNQQNSSQQIRTFSGDSIGWIEDKHGRFKSAYTNFSVKCLITGQCNGYIFPAAGSVPNVGLSPTDTPNDPFIKLLSQF